MADFTTERVLSNEISVARREADELRKTLVAVSADRLEAYDEAAEWKAIAEQLAKALRIHKWHPGKHGEALAAFDRKAGKP